MKLRMIGLIQASLVILAITCLSECNGEFASDGNTTTRRKLSPTPAATSGDNNNSNDSTQSGDGNDDANATVESGDETNDANEAIVTNGGMQDGNAASGDVDTAKRPYPIAVACAQFAPDANAKTWYVDPVNGSEDNDGSESAPWRTLEEVADNGLIETYRYEPTPYSDGNSKLVIVHADAPVKAGDTLLLLTGNHGEFMVIGAHNKDFITIKNVPGHTPVLEKFHVRSGSKWHLKGVHMRRPAESTASSHFVFLESHSFHGPTHDIIIADNSIKSADDSSAWTAEEWANKAKTGVEAKAACVTVVGNDLETVGMGINLGKDNSTAHRNTINRYTKDGMRMNGDNIVASQNVITNNYNIDDNHDDGIQSFTNSGNPYENLTITENIIIENTEIDRPHQGPLQGIGFFDGFYDNLRIVNNLIIVGAYHGIGLYGLRGALIANNTVIDPKSSNQTWIGVFPHKNKTPNRDVVVRNNITTKLSLTKEGLTADNNIVTTVPAEHLVKYDPETATYDGHLKSDSTARDSCSSEQAPAYDLEGNKRDATVDCGAYEFAPR